jgi:hypothetical protein
MAEQAITARGGVPAATARRQRPNKALDLRYQPGFGTIAICCLVLLYAPILVLVISAFASYGNGIAGSEKFLPEEFANSPEIKAPDGSPTPEFVPPCPKAVLEVYNKIWTNLRK